MAIVDTNSVSVAGTTLVLVDSNAASNWSAIDEIEQWAANNNAKRSAEFWLQQLTRDGNKIFRGICILTP